MTALVRYDEACRALAAARAVDEVKDIRDRSEALRAYARQSKNRQLEIDASEIRIRSERRLGELVEEQRRAGLLAGGGRPNAVLGRTDGKVTLQEAGIDKHLADRARKYARVPSQEFESILVRRRELIADQSERITTDLFRARSSKVGTAQEPSLLNDTIVRDGRSLGDLAWHDLEKLAAINEAEAALLRRVQSHAANVESHQLVRDVLSEDTLTKLVGANT